MPGVCVGDLFVKTSMASLKTKRSHVGETATYNGVEKRCT